MGFFKKIFKKLKPSPMNKVYGGPEYFRKKSEMKCVYAGPEYFDKKRKNTSAEGVYAGPEYFNKKREDAEIEDVYNGPDMFDEPDDPDEIALSPDSDAGYPANHAAGEDDVPYPENHTDTDDAGPHPGNQAAMQKDDASVDPDGAVPEGSADKITDSRPIGFVYAGPAYFKGKNGFNPPIEAVYAAPQQPPAEMFMCVYAGPDFFSGKDPDGIARPDDVPSDTFKMNPGGVPRAAEVPEGAWRCPACGNINYGGFCSECGTKRPEPPKGGPKPPTNPTMLA
ncbi:MAG: hypothetical protein J6U61_09815 [Lachnospiraceae bacterium]|nr:hypothetical protein [Lachnospiraceae bacterium]